MDGAVRLWFDMSCFGGINKTTLFVANELGEQNNTKGQNTRYGSTAAVVVATRSSKESEVNQSSR